MNDQFEATRNESDRAQPYRIVPVSEEVIDQFARTHGGQANEKHWVLYNIRWAEGYPMFTAAASTCLVLIFSHHTAPKIGLGHLPIFFGSQGDKTKEIEQLEEARDTLSSGGHEWDLDIFGGQPIDDTQDSREIVDTNVREVMSMFADVGVACRDHTHRDPDQVVVGVIADPTVREIQVCEE